MVLAADAAYAGPDESARRERSKALGLFDNVTDFLDGLQGGEGEEGEGAMNVVGSLARPGGDGSSGDVVSSLLGGMGQGRSAPAHQEAGQGGLAGMLEQLAASGLGEHVSSWLSDNPNLPISPEQIRDALGGDQVRRFAASSGLPIGDFLQQLAQHLPAAASEAAGTNDG